MPNTPKYNVLMLGWEFYPVFAGGMGVVTAEIVGGLTDANIGVHFVIPRLPKEISVNKVFITSAADYNGKSSSKLKIEEYTKNVERTYVDTKFAPYETTNLFRSNNSSNKSFIFDNIVNNTDISNNGKSGKSIYSDLFREIKIFEDKTALIALDSDFDLIHAHDWITFRAAVTAKKLTGKPIVLHVHATEFDRSGENPNMMVFNIEKECLDQADFVIAVSNKGKDDLVNKYGINPHKIFVVHNSTNFAQTHNRTILGKDDQIVMFLGRVTMQKGPEYFIHAAAKVLKFLPNTIFVMVGDGDMLPRCIDIVNELGIEKNFIFTGFLTGNQKDQIYASADLFVMPSVSEPFGIVALEAIKSGTPVIVSKTSGAAEIIDNSLKVDFWDINKLADMIHASLKYKSLHSQLIENQTEDVNSQNWNHQIDVIIKVYEMAMKNKAF